MGIFPDHALGNPMPTRTWAEGSGKRFEGASYEEALEAVGTHEVYHNEKKQIQLDIESHKSNITNREYQE